MKHIDHIAFGALALLLFSCAEDPVQEKEGEDTVLHLSSAVVTKTWLDDETCQVWWSDGDKVNVNGQTSLPLSVGEGQKTGEADFSLRSVEAPFRVVYPAEAVSEEAYAADGTIGITLPEEQDWTEGSFANGAAVMYGYSKEGRATLHNLMAAVKVSLVSESADVIESVCLTTTDSPLCGRFRLNPETGELSVTQAAHSLSLALAQPVTLGTETADFYLTLPPGTYPEGIGFRFVRAGDHRAMVCRWTPAEALEAGKLYCFEALEFVPGAKDIETADEWEEFVLAANTGLSLSKYLYKDGVVRLGADLTAGDLTRLEGNLTFTIDGQGHSITRTAATHALLRNIRCSVRNLVLEGTLEADGSQAPLADTLYAGGSISGVTSNMTVTGSVGTAGVALSGLVVVGRGGTISHCRNTGSITAHVDCTEGIFNCQVAGILCQVNNLEEALVVEGCTNAGALTVHPVITGTSFGTGYAGLGGIVGWIRSTHFKVTVKDCTNAASLTWNAAQAQGRKAATCVGGIVGIGAPVNQSTLLAPEEENGFLIELAGCTNTGSITCKALSNSASSESRNKVYIGGLAGSLQGRNSSWAVVDGCSSRGDITPYDITSDAPYYASAASARAAFCAAQGGICGWGGYVDIKDGTVVDCSVGTINRQAVSVAGAIGFAVRPFSVRGSDIFCKGSFNRCPGYKDNRAVVAVVPVKYNATAMGDAPAVAGSRIENCRLGGALSTNTATFDYTVVTCLSSNATIFTSESSALGNLVAGQGYTTASQDITQGGNTFWNGL